MVCACLPVGLTVSSAKRPNRLRCSLEADSCVPKEQCFRWGAHRRHLAQMDYLCGGDDAIILLIEVILRSVRGSRTKYTF